MARGADSYLHRLPVPPPAPHKLHLPPRPARPQAPPVQLSPRHRRQLRHSFRLLCPHRRPFHVHVASVFMDSAGARGPATWRGSTRLCCWHWRQREHQLPQRATKYRLAFAKMATQARHVLFHKQPVTAVTHFVAWDPGVLRACLAFRACPLTSVGMRPRRTRRSARQSLAAASCEAPGQGRALCM